VSYQTYTVKSGDTLSAIARAHGLSGWQELYNYNKGVIGKNPNYILPNQVYNIPGTYQAPAPAPVAAPPPPAVDPVIQQVQEIQKYKPTREAFESKIGGKLEDFIAGSTAQLHQFAAQHINPEALRASTRAIRQASMGAGGGMAETSGYGRAQGQELLDALERSRKEEIDRTIKQQQGLIGKWFGDEYSGYQLAESPDWLASMAGLEPIMGQGWTLPKKPGTYQDVNLTDIFSNMGSNYGQLPTNLYGSIQY
jgi:hypothetical protein